MVRVDGKMDRAKYKGNDTGHTTGATVEWFRSKRINVLEWPSQNPDLNPIENLWLVLKMVVNRWSLFNLTELELFCEEKGANKSVSRCAKVLEKFFFFFCNHVLYTNKVEY